jgi:phenylacetate-CoA ligase
MRDGLLRAYHALPPWARTVAAATRGVYLNAWRYGAETERLVEEALERDTWSPEQWRRWQEERLAFLLHRAATRVPYYRSQWQERRRRGDRASWEVLANWPILDKQVVREHSHGFLADDCNPRQLFEEHTSGTTGGSLRLWCSRTTLRRWYALFEARCRRWHGLTRQDRWAILGGQLVAPVQSRRPPFWVWNPAMRQLYMSAYHLAPDLVPHYLDALQRHRITYIIGYTSALNSLARHALELGRADIRLKVAITNAEPVFGWQRSAISRAFNCPVQETYGMAEYVAAAGDCDHGTLHMWPDTGVVETDGDAALLGTGLLNDDMPLIRYRVGDRVRCAVQTALCGCNRTLPVLGQIEGRTDDVLHTRDGRQVGRLDPVFKADLPVVEAQIIQDTTERVQVLYVPTPEFDETHATDLVRRIQERLGPIEVDLRRVGIIPRQANGKFRAVISRVPSHQHTRAEGAAGA